jgi:hypothetical protein
MNLKTLVIYIALAGISNLSASNEKILKKIDSYRVGDGEIFLEIFLEDIDGQDTSKELVHVFTKDANHSLVLFKNRGDGKQALLNIDENMWMKFPNSRNAIRITPMQQLLGNASNGDVARMSFYEDYDIDSSYLDSTKKNTLILNLISKQKKNTYKKIRLEVDSKTYIPSKAEYFMSSGKNFKTATYDKFKPFNGSLRLYQITFISNIKKQSKTIMTYKKVLYKKIPHKFYNRNYLKNADFRQLN